MLPLNGLKIYLATEPVIRHRPRTDGATVPHSGREWTGWRAMS